MKNFEAALRLIVDWPEIVYEEEAFPDVIEFCRFFLSSDDHASASISSKVEEISKHVKEAINNKDVAKMKNLENEYRALMRDIKKRGGVL